MTLHYLLILLYYVDQLFSVDGLFWTYWRLIYYVNGLALSFCPSFFFESGLNVVNKLMHSLITNQLNCYWSKILISNTKDWTGNSQWYSVVLFHGTILSGSKGDDYFEIKSIVTSHAVNYNSSERLFQMFNPHASLCFILFVFFFPAHFSLHRLLSIWTAAKGNSGMIAWIYHNVKLFAKKRLDMYPPTRVRYV